MVWCSGVCDDVILQDAAGWCSGAEMMMMMMMMLFSSIQRPTGGRGVLFWSLLVILLYVLLNFACRDIHGP